MSDAKPEPAMRERIAERLYRLDASNESVRWVSWPFAPARKQQRYRERADVVLEELARPTEAMTDAAAESGVSDDLRQGNNAERVWRAMVDAARK